MIDEPENKTDSRADYEARDEREIKCPMLAAVNDVSRQAAKAKGKFRSKIKERADDDEHSSDENEQTSQLLCWFHCKIVAPE
jgi:hypothetical protein